MREKLMVIFYAGFFGTMLFGAISGLFHIKIFGVMAAIFFATSSIILLIAIIIKKD